MKVVRIKFDFSHGPIWKDIYDINTGEWLTGVEVIDNDKALSVLNDEAGKLYSSFFFFDKAGAFVFDSKAYEEKKEDLMSLVQTIKLRIDSLNDGSFHVIDEEGE